MDVGEWEMLCKDAGILGTKGMTFGKVDTIFIAANYAAKAAKKNSEKKFTPSLLSNVSLELSVPRNLSYIQDPP